MNSRLLTGENLLKAFKEPRKAASILLQQTLAPFGRNDYKKFVVLTRDRTGSNLLVQALNSHPRIASDYEIFGLLRGESEREILERCFSKQPFYIEAKGFKIFYYHPQDAEHSPIWEMLERMHDLSVIHLKRRNYLRTEISSRIAYTTGVYGVRNEKELDKYKELVVPISFKPEELERLFLKNQEWENNSAKRFAEHRSLGIDYEDLSVDVDREYRRALEFLGVDYRLPRIDFKKQAITDMREQLSNYQELKSVFLGTQWGVFFED